MGMVSRKSLVLLVKNTRPSVCPFKKSPCVPAPRAHVSTHVRVVPVHKVTFWTYTRRRVEWTHGVFQRVTHDTPHRTHTPHHTTTEHNTTTRPQHHTETGTETDRQTDRQTKKTGTEREDKTEEERQDKRREDKRRQEKTRQEKERRFICSVVVHGRSLLMECFVLLNPSTLES